jgi:hypothetical protein
MIVKPGVATSYEEPTGCDPWPWYSDPDGVYAATPVWIETYRGWNIWDLTEVEPGAHTYGASDPECVGMSTFSYTLDGIKTLIDKWIGPGTPTTITINAPGKIDAGQPFTLYGNLYETETGVLIRGQRVEISYDEKSLGYCYTGQEGDYNIDVSIGEMGTWTLKAYFAGTPGYEASRSFADALVGVSTMDATIKIAAPAVLGLALVTYSLS